MQSVCVLCGGPARSFLDDVPASPAPLSGAPSRPTCLCSAHAPEEDALRAGEELGMYAETDGCGCDTWR